MKVKTLVFLVLLLHLRTVAQNDPVAYRNVFKINPIQGACGTPTLYYERFLKSGHSLEFSVGYPMYSVYLEDPGYLRSIKSTRSEGFALGAGFIKASKKSLHRAWQFRLYYKQNVMSSIERLDAWALDDHYEEEGSWIETVTKQIISPQVFFVLRNKPHNPVALELFTGPALRMVYRTTEIESATDAETRTTEFFTDNVEHRQFIYPTCHVGFKVGFRK